MLEVLKILTETPVPLIFMLLGAVILFLFFVKIKSRFFELPDDRRKMAAVFGIIFFSVGILIQILPAFAPLGDPRSNTLSEIQLSQDFQRVETEAQLRGTVVDKRLLRGIKDDFLILRPDNRMVGRINNLKAEGIWVFSKGEFCRMFATYERDKSVSKTYDVECFDLRVNAAGLQFGPDSADLRTYTWGP